MTKEQEQQLNQLITLCQEFSFHELEEEAREIKRESKKGEIILVVGPGKKGKSTLINALIGQPIAPIGNDFTTTDVLFYQSGLSVDSENIPIAYIDTPADIWLQREGDLYNKYHKGCELADMVLLCVHSARLEDKIYFDQMHEFLTQGKKVIVVLTYADQIPSEDWDACLEKAHKLYNSVSCDIVLSAVGSRDSFYREATIYDVKNKIHQYAVEDYRSRQRNMYEDELKKCKEALTVELTKKADIYYHNLSIYIRMLQLSKEKLREVYQRVEVEVARQKEEVIQTVFSENRMDIAWEKCGGYTEHFKAEMEEAYASYHLEGNIADLIAEYISQARMAELSITAQSTFKECDGKDNVKDLGFTKELSKVEINQTAQLYQWLVGIDYDVYQKESENIKKGRHAVSGFQGLKNIVNKGKKYVNKLLIYSTPKNNCISFLETQNDALLQKISVWNQMAVKQMTDFLKVRFETISQNTEKGSRNELYKFDKILSSLGAYDSQVKYIPVPDQESIRFLQSIYVKKVYTLYQIKEEEIARQVVAEYFPYLARYVEGGLEAYCRKIEQSYRAEARFHEDIREVAQIQELEDSVLNNRFLTGQMPFWPSIDFGSGHIFVEESYHTMLDEFKKKYYERIRQIKETWNQKQRIDATRLIEDYFKRELLDSLASWHERSEGILEAQIKAGSFAVPPDELSFVKYFRERYIKTGRIVGDCRLAKSLTNPALRKAEWQIEDMEDWRDTEGRSIMHYINHTMDERVRQIGKKVEVHEAELEKRWKQAVNISYDAQMKKEG